MMDDDTLREAQRATKAVLKAWADIHLGYEDKLVGKMVDSMLDIVLTEWEQWVRAVHNAGVSYTEVSAEFVGEVMADPNKAVQNTTQTAWDNANATLAEILVRRWNGPILANVLNAITHRSDEIRQELVEKAREHAEKQSEPPQKAGKRKLRRRIPVTVGGPQNGAE